MAITLLELRTQCRNRANMEESNFVTDTELNSYINNSIAELHDILIQCYGSDYYTKNVEFTLTSNIDSYSLDTLITAKDFYKIEGLDAKINNRNWTTLTPFNFNERNRFQNSRIWDRFGITNMRYRVVGNNLIISPIPSSSIPCRLWYIPTATVLTTDTSELADLNKYSEYVITDAVIKMLEKEESDVSVFLAQKVALKKRIEEAAQNRDAGKPESVSDIYIEGYYWWV